MSEYIEHLVSQQKKSRLSIFLLRALKAGKKIDNILYHSKNRPVSELYLKTKSIKKKIFSEQFTFVSLCELGNWTTKWIKRFPTDYDIIVGIPRSGLVVASIIAVKLGKPLATPDLFIKNEEWKSNFIPKKGEYTRILLIDDSVSSGKALGESYNLLKSYNKNLKITKGALIVTENSRQLVDLYYKIIPHPRIFEWNLLHAKKGKVASDLDGVICENCPPGVDSNEKLYIEWLENVRPYLIPSFEIDAILSSRLEKYRSETETWLSNHRVRYKELILWNIQSKADRRGRHAEHKIDALLKIKPDIFWESSLWEATKISRATNIPTLCIDEMLFFR